MSVSDLISAYEAEREAHAVALEDGDLATIQREMATPISESATEPFTSRFGVDYHCRGDCWAVTLSGFTDSICQTEPEARDRAEKLEVLEAQYHDRRRKSNVA